MSDKSEDSSKQTDKMETLGYIAGILTTIAFVPQVLQIYKKNQRSTFH